MSRKDLIPHSDALFDTFMTSFFTIILANLLKWKIPQLAVDPSTQLLINWKASYGVCQVANAASTLDTDQKNADKAALTAFTRKFIQKYVYLNDYMDDNAIKSCGLIPHSKEKKHAGKPDSIPAVAFKNGPAFSVAGTYSQPTGEAGTSKRGKPAGVGTFQVSSFMGAVAPVNPKGYTRSDLFTTTPFKIVFEPEDAGKTVWLIARWVSTDHIPGDWSKALSITIY